MAGRQAGRHRRPLERQATYREVFAIGEFRALWLAQAFSYIGDQLAQVALAVLVYHRTGSPLLTAVAYALTYLPPIVGGPVLSGLADMFPRRSVMVVCDLVRAALVALMALQAMPFPVLCVLVFLTVLLGAPFTAARAALLPDVLDGDRYVAGSAINNITHQATQMLGFVAGGALVAVVGTYQALAIDAMTFGVSALILLLWLKPRPAPREGGQERISLWRNTRAGAKLVFGDPALRSLVSFAWLCAFYVIPEGLAAPYAATYPGSTAVTVGLLMSAMPTGMVVGAFVFSRFVRPSNRIRAMGWMSILACAPLIGSGLHPPLWAVILLWALSGMGSAYQLAANAAFVAAVPASGRGQAFGLAQSGILAGQGIGILVGGVAAEVLGPETVVALAGVVGLSVATLLTMLWTPVRGEIIASMFGRSTPVPSDVPDQDTADPVPNAREAATDPAPQDTPAMGGPSKPTGGTGATPSTRPSGGGVATDIPDTVAIGSAEPTPDPLDADAPGAISLLKPTDADTPNASPPPSSPSTDLTTHPVRPTTDAAARTPTPTNGAAPETEPSPEAGLPSAQAAHVAGGSSAVDGSSPPHWLEPTTGPAPEADPSHVNGAEPAGALPFSTESAPEAEPESAPEAEPSPAPKSAPTPESAPAPKAESAPEVEPPAVAEPASEVGLSFVGEAHGEDGGSFGDGSSPEEGDQAEGGDGSREVGVVTVWGPWEGPDDGGLGVTEPLPKVGGMAGAEVAEPDGEVCFGVESSDEGVDGAGWTRVDAPAEVGGAGGCGDDGGGVEQPVIGVRARSEEAFGERSVAGDGGPECGLAEAVQATAEASGAEVRQVIEDAREGDDGPGGGGR
ncbi:MFS transporter [Thermomonospora umbrina]|uniref:Putative MFS family arabinose efflux permease n=1 Tax=Thermomonospora umbrina TaxID=111806 RepID=A0A3D9SYJ7_9ACTN|nr:MFS transporter [Thermomonospora umbrina]REE96691.1 putative MFS family arabinose efflux permease [Thermomonospora umbrina]